MAFFYTTMHKLNKFEVMMKKLLLSTVLAASVLSTPHAESFSGFYVAGKGAFLFLNKASLPDLSKNDLNSDATKDYGDFGAHGASGGAELGYSFRFANNFVIGASLGGGYTHSSIKEAINTEAGEDRNRIGLDFINSSLYTEARLRLGMVFRRFHVFLNPGLSLNYKNPELTFYSLKDDGGKADPVKLTYKTDKEPDWKERLGFVVSLNVEYAVTQTVFVGGNIGFRYEFADVKNMADALTDDVKTNGHIKDIAYKNPYGMEIGISAGASF